MLKLIVGYLNALSNFVHCRTYHILFLFSTAYRLAGSFNLRGRLRQLFVVLSDDNIGSGPRPEPHSLQDPLESFPQAELVDQAVEQIRQDHMYLASPKSSSQLTTQASQKSANSQTSKQGGQSKRKSDDSDIKSGKKR